MAFGVIKASSGEGKTEKCPAGNHLAVCVGVFDMGHQLNDGPMGNGKWQHRAYFLYELVDEKMTGMRDANHVIGIDLTLSLHEKAKLRLWIEARTGKKLPDDAELDPTSELGTVSMLNVVLNKGGYPQISGMAAAPKRLAEGAKASYPLTAITLEEFQAGTSIPDYCPWLYGSPLADHIRASREIGEAKPRAKKADKPAGGTQYDPNATTAGGEIPF